MNMEEFYKIVQQWKPIADEVERIAREINARYSDRFEEVNDLVFVSLDNDGDILLHGRHWFREDYASVTFPEEYLWTDYMAAEQKHFEAKQALRQEREEKERLLTEKRDLETYARLKEKYEGGKTT